VGQERRTSQYSLESVECLNVCFIKDEFVVDPSQLRKGSGRTAVVADEAPVKVAKPKERLHFTDRSRVLPARNYLYFVWVDPYSVRKDNKAEVFNLLNTKLILLDICLKASSL
jgi:hypothetical protein